MKKTEANEENWQIWKNKRNISQPYRKNKEVTQI